MPRMVSTTCATTSPPCVATVEASSASRLAWCALSAFWCTVDDSSSIDAAVSSSALAWLSVRVDRSLLPCAISVEAWVMLTVESRTCATSRCRLDCMRDRSAIRPTVFCSASALAVRSPSATRLNAARACAGSPPSSRCSVRTITTVSAKATATASSASAVAAVCMRPARVWVASFAAAAVLRAPSSCCSNAPRSERQAGVSWVLSSVTAAALSLRASVCTWSCTANWLLRKVASDAMPSSKAVPLALCCVAA